MVLRCDGLGFWRMDRNAFVDFFGKGFQVVDAVEHIVVLKVPFET